MTKIRTVRQFPCDMCGTLVILHDDDMYTQYGYFTNCTSRNAPHAKMFQDGFSPIEFYLCVKCKGIVQEFIEGARAKIGMMS